MSFHDYLRELASDGASDGRGSFTLAPDEARKKLAESVPPAMDSPWAGAALLLQALQMWQDSHLPAGADGELGRARVGFVRRPRLDGVQDVALKLSGLVQTDEVKQALTCLRTLMEECWQRPFRTTEPLALCFSRAFIVLSRHGVGLHIRFGAGNLEALIAADEKAPLPDQGLVKAAGAPQKGEVMILCGKCRAWLTPPPRPPDGSEAFVQIGGQLLRSWVGAYPFGQLPESFRQRSVATVGPLGSLFKTDSAWTRCPSRESTRLCLRLDSAVSWYDYRAKKPILLEYLVASQAPSPLPVAPDTVRKMSGHTVERIGESHSSWQRVMSQCENLILRRWTHPPEASPSGDFFARAIFSIALSDAPSRAIFANWGNTLELTPLPELPPGLAACVWWPELRQSLYGESWVQDEAYRQALDWTIEQGRKAFALLESEFDYLWSMLAQDHVSSSSRSDVRQRVERWLRPPP